MYETAFINSELIKLLSELIFTECEEIMVSNVIYIPATKKNPTSNDERKIRVAAYCRVSTKLEIQESSIKTQVSFFKEEFKKHDDWESVGIFTDGGTSGLRTKGRTQFKKMLRLCEKGKIDMIITKSISRFSRNTYECLEVIRRLSALNINIRFLKENIDTISLSGMLLVTILAAFAQQESESLSQNISLGIEYRFQQGKEFINCNRFLGYNKDKNGYLIIDEKQEETVRRIFNEYLSGFSGEKIARHLTEDKIPNGAGNTKWNSNNIYRILQNERYIGDALCQKTFTVDSLTGKKKKNEGERVIYYITGCHEPIISKEVFEQVKAEMQKRRDSSARKIYSSHPYAGKIICGVCGDLYRRIVWTNNNKRYIVWRCITRMQKGKEVCNSRTVYEYEIDEIINYHNHTNHCNEEFVRNIVKKIIIVE